MKAQGPVFFLLIVCSMQPTASCRESGRRLFLRKRLEEKAAQVLQ